MAQEAHLFLGPRDGDIVSLIEPVKRITILTDQGDALYEREESQRAPGAFNYNYVGMKQKEQPHEDSQD